VQEGSLIPRYGRARRDAGLAVLEGLHPLKHGLRFGARVLDVRTRDREQLDRLLAELAPDVRSQALELAQEVSPEVFERLVPLAPATGVVALAERTPSDPAAMLAAAEPAPLILLEDPRDLGNLGACVRVAAAGDAAGVLTLGGHDPWHPDALRGAAGLHFALPVARSEGPDALAALRRPLLALDPDGAELDAAALPEGAVLAFGSERRGLSDDLLARADARLRIPMRAGVSSLNLATSVAAVLFAWRLAAPRQAPPGAAAGGARTPG
jgi:TrmH family RNA methyltransferase